MTLGLFTYRSFRVGHTSQLILESRKKLDSIRGNDVLERDVTSETRLLLLPFGDCLSALMFFDPRLEGYILGHR